jgi:hypothetical protein
MKFNNIFVNEEDHKARMDEYYYSLKEAFVEANKESVNIMNGGRNNSNDIHTGYTL